MFRSDQCYSLSKKEIKRKKKKEKIKGEQKGKRR